jgi:uncharacterized protein
MKNELAMATRMRIFIDQADRYGRQPLSTALVDELRACGLAGATVLRGIEGYGAGRKRNLPVVLEVADAEAKVRSVIPRLREMIEDGLITLERIRMRPVRKS